MKGQDIRKLAIYLHNISLDTFARDVYNKDPKDNYVVAKYHRMQCNQTGWIAELDNHHLDVLAQCVEEYNG